MQLKYMFSRFLLLTWKACLNLHSLIAGYWMNSHFLPLDGTYWACMQFKENPWIFLSNLLYLLHFSIDPESWLHWHKLCGLVSPSQPVSSELHLPTTAPVSEQYASAFVIEKVWYSRSVDERRGLQSNDLACWSNKGFASLSKICSSCVKVCEPALAFSCATMSTLTYTSRTDCRRRRLDEVVAPQKTLTLPTLHSAGWSLQILDGINIWFSKLTKFSLIWSCASLLLQSPE